MCSFSQRVVRSPVSHQTLHPLPSLSMAPCKMGRPRDRGYLRGDGIFGCSMMYEASTGGEKHHGELLGDEVGLGLLPHEVWVRINVYIPEGVGICQEKNREVLQETGVLLYLLILLFDICLGQCVTFVQVNMLI